MLGSCYVSQFRPGHRSGCVIQFTLGSAIRLFFPPWERSGSMGSMEPVRDTSIDSESAMILEENMRTPVRRIVIAAAAAVTIAGTTAILPTAANAQHWHGHGGHWGGGHWHGGGSAFAGASGRDSHSVSALPTTMAALMRMPVTAPRDAAGSSIVMASVCGGGSGSATERRVDTTGSPGRPGEPDFCHARQRRTHGAKTPQPMGQRR